VFRLSGSLPVRIIQELQDKRDIYYDKIKKVTDPSQRKKIIKDFQFNYFNKYDSILNSNSTGPAWLKNDSIASVVKHVLHKHDNKEYILWAYTIMSNHVHAILEFVHKEPFYPTEFQSIYFYNAKFTPLSNVLRLIKGYTARIGNEILKRKGSFWQHESYDHVIRDEDEFENSIWYVLNNPVSAGIVNSWKDYKWNYAKREFFDDA